MRQLLVCCDGTWNTPDQKSAGVPCPTNVVKLFNACLEDTHQRRYYHPGIGTEGSVLRRTIDGGMGSGLDRNIQSAYRWLCRQHQPGDRIFLFGFSRGAYTVRSLAGMMTSCGLLDLSGLDEATAWTRIDTAFQRVYRQRQRVEDWGEGWAWRVPAAEVQIEFLGVWDTVGACGIPDDLVLLDALFDDPQPYRFHDTVLSNQVRHARHAVALDELRASFAPTLWQPPPDRPPTHTLKQLWFAGDHGDIGGGHVQSALSDHALKWMCEEAGQAGLHMNPALLAQLRPDHHGVLHDEVEGLWKHLRTLPRAIPTFSAANVGGVLHPSAWRRHFDPPITQAPYGRHVTLQPGQSWSGAIYARERWNRTGVWLEAGVGYTFEARGEWIDLKNRSGPGGMRDGHFQLGELAYRFGDLVALGEGAYRRLTHKREADWWATRRFEGADWFALVGMVANQPEVHRDGTAPLGETFCIGDGCTFTPQRAGYLHAFANDAWHFYGHNRGSVSLRVRRV